MPQLDALVRWLLGLVLVMLLPPQASAQDLGKPYWLEQAIGTRFTSRRDNGPMMQLLKPLVQEAGEATVQVVCGGKPVALGMIVAPEGFVLTKQSELTEESIRVRLADQRLLTARLVATRRTSDLALLAVEGLQEVKPLRFSEALPAVASFLVSVGRGGRPIGLGVMGVLPREVKHVGRLGVVLRDDGQGRARVEGVWPESGADEAGMLPGDRIVAVDDQQTAGRDAVIDILRDRYPGERVELTIVREEEPMQVAALIRDFSLLQESENDARVNGARSKRLSGFEQVFQHDTPLEPDQCGGPILDSQGRVVGMNIARAGRVVTYAIPASLLNQHLAALLEDARRPVAE
jgi:S1-C subfamily serine protease